MCNCEGISLSPFSDEAYRKARIKAAELDTSVSALVREFLQSLVSEGSDFEAPQEASG